MSEEPANTQITDEEDNAMGNAYMTTHRPVSAQAKRLRYGLAVVLIVVGLALIFV